MKFQLFISFSFVVGAAVFLVVDGQQQDATTTAGEDNSTTAAVATNFTDSLGRSMSLSGVLEQLPRQGRIINDEKISIKGFIPIVGISGNGGNSDNDAKSTIPERRNPVAGFPVSDESDANLYDDQAMLQQQLPQHHAGPEDQRFIGAAIQGLIGGNPFRPKPINRKSDCICVPFYLCRNGFIVNSAVGGNGGGHPALYHQRPDIPPSSYDHLQLSQADMSGYGAINERSEPTTANDHQKQYSDLNDTRFAEEILGRMIGASQSDQRCGLLRTCCQRPPSPSGYHHQYPHQMHPNSMISNTPEYILQPEPSSYLPSMVGHQPPFQPGAGLRPGMIRQVPNNRPPKIIRPVESSFSPMRGGFPPQLATAAYQNCGARQSVGINGRVQNLNYHQSSTEFAEFPWQVAILKRIGPSDNLYVCGGALITANFVITAAHCIKKFQSGDLKIRLGEWDVHREDEFYPYVEKNVEELFLHPGFVPRNLMNDVALLRLDGDVDLSQNPHISPICMPQPFESFAGQRCYVAGWGKNAFGHQGEYQSVLMKVDLPVLDNRNCETLLRHTKLGHQFRLDRSMICAGGEPGKDACEGDGGSGLVCETPGTGIWKVAGLVSWGLGCGQGGVPGVYTNVGQLRPWIDKIVLAYRPFYHQQQQQQLNFNELINERNMPSVTNADINGNQTKTITTTTTTTENNNSTSNS